MTLGLGMVSCVEGEVEVRASWRGGALVCSAIGCVQDVSDCLVRPMWVWRLDFGRVKKYCFFRVLIKEKA